MTAPWRTGPNPNLQALNGSGTARGPGKWAESMIQPSRVNLFPATILKEAEVVHLIVWNHAWKFPYLPPLVI